MLCKFYIYLNFTHVCKSVHVNANTYLSKFVNIHLGLTKCKSIFTFTHIYIKYFSSYEQKVNLLMCISALTGCSICVHSISVSCASIRHKFKLFFLNRQYGEIFNGCRTYFINKSLRKICDHMYLCIGQNSRLLDWTGPQWMSLGQFFPTNELMSPISIYLLFGSIPKSFFLVCHCKKLLEDILTQQVLRNDWC